MRGNFILYFLEAVMTIAAGLTFTSQEHQQYLEVLLLIVMVGSLIHAITAFATVCGWKKWPLIVLNAITLVTSIVMLIMNAKTDEDAKLNKVAVPWESKVILLSSVALTVAVNAALIPKGQNWWCSGQTDDLICVNKDNRSALDISVRKYFNAELGEKKPLKKRPGNKARKVDLNDLKDDKLEEAKIAYITVDDEGNEIFDCKSFKSKVDRMTADILTTKKQEQIKQKQDERKQLREDKKKQQDISFDPSKPQYKYVGGGIGGIGAKKVAVAPPAAGITQFQKEQAEKQAEAARLRAVAKQQAAQQQSLKERLAAGKISMAKRAKQKQD